MFATLWDSINAKPRKINPPDYKTITILENSWESNPWVFRYEFKYLPDYKYEVKPETAIRG
jgi:hypothetical protein